MAIAVSWRKVEHFLEEEMHFVDDHMDNDPGENLDYLQGFGDALAATHTKMQELRREVEGG